MRRKRVDIVFIENKEVYGLWMFSNDRTISSDINILSQKYYDTLGLSKGEVLPYYVLTRNYNENTKDFELFIGSTINHSSLESLKLQSGDYAKMKIQPKLGFVWGPSIGEAKRYFYTQWLPNSHYQALNLEYEYHDEKSIEKHPSVELIFAIERKE